jgi:uncharacterized lipoprotein YajG
VKSKGFVLSSILLLSSCTTTQIVLPFSCYDTDMTCERNLNAQTLSLIGQEEAAIRLMCSDPDVRDVMGEECTGTEQ